MLDQLFKGVSKKTASSAVSNLFSGTPVSTPKPVVPSPTPAPAPVTPVTPAVKTLPSGGQYLSMPDGSLTTTPRNYGSMQPKAGYERDHIIPVSLGGTSNDPNLQYLKDNKSFLESVLNKPASSKNRQEGKMLVEWGAIEDYKSGKISLNEARQRVLNWNNQPEPVLKSYAKGILETPGNILGKLFNNFKEDINALTAKPTTVQPIKRSIESMKGDVLSSGLNKPVQLNASENGITMPVKLDLSKYDTGKSVSQIPGITKSFSADWWKRALEQAVNTPSQAVGMFNKSMQDLGDAIFPITKVDDVGKKSEVTPAKRIAAMGEAALGTANLIPGWQAFNTALNVAEQTPSLSSVATAIKKGFEYLAKGGAYGSSKLIDILPISDESKNELRPIAENVGGFLTQILVLHSLKKGATEIGKMEIPGKKVDLTWGDVRDITIGKEVSPEKRAIFDKITKEGIDLKELKKGYSERLPGQTVYDFLKQKATEFSKNPKFGLQTEDVSKRAEDALNKDNKSNGELGKLFGNVGPVNAPSNDVIQKTESDVLSAALKNGKTEAETKSMFLSLEKLAGGKNSVYLKNLENIKDRQTKAVEKNKETINSVTKNLSQPIQTTPVSEPQSIVGKKFYTEENLMGMNGKTKTIRDEIKVTEIRNDRVHFESVSGSSKGSMSMEYFNDKIKNGAFSEVGKKNEGITITNPEGIRQMLSGKAQGNTGDYIKKPLTPEKTPEHNTFEKAYQMKTQSRVDRVVKNIEILKKSIDKEAELAKQAEGISNRYDKRTPEQQKIWSEYQQVKSYNKDNAVYYSHWSKPENLDKLRTPNENNKTSYREEYIKTVKKLISQGYDVPKEIIDQFPEFKKAVNARARYEKGLNTSFANKSTAVDYSTKKDYGFKVKNQDGTAISEQHIRSITMAAHELEQAIGPIKDIVDHYDLTVAHTKGKFPFLRGDAGGLYSHTDRTITVGIDGVKAFAHEMAHFIDHVSGSGATTIRKGLTRGGNYNQDLIHKADKEMNGTEYQIEKAMQTTGKLSDAQKRNAGLLKARLGKYYSSNNEIFARLVEQYVSEKIGGRLKGSASVLADGQNEYHELLGYWSKDTFAELKPMVEAEIQRKIEAARTIAGTKPENFGGVYEVAEKAPEMVESTGQKGLFELPEVTPKNAIKNEIKKYDKIISDLEAKVGNEPTEKEWDKMTEAEKKAWNDKMSEINDLAIKRSNQNNKLNLLEFGERLEKENSQKIDKQEILSKALKRQIGDIFEDVKPVGSLWQQKGNTIFISLKKDNPGFVKWMRLRNFVKSAEEAGNNVYRIELEPSMLKEVSKIAQDYKSITKIPENDEVVADKYLNREIDRGEAVVIDPDEVKKMEKDVSEENSKKFSLIAQVAYEKALQIVKNPTVKMLSGIPGSGKSDVLLKKAKEGFDGIIFDAPHTNEGVILRRMRAAKQQNKKVNLTVLIQDPRIAWYHTLLRAKEIGRKVDLNYFIDRVLELPVTYRSLISHFPELVDVVDIRGITNLEQAKQVRPVSGNKALDIFNNLNYDKNELYEQLSKITTDKGIAGILSEGQQGIEPGAARTIGENEPAIQGEAGGLGELSQKDRPNKRRINKNKITPEEQAKIDEFSALTTEERIARFNAKESRTDFNVGDNVSFHLIKKGVSVGLEPEVYKITEIIKDKGRKIKIELTGANGNTVWTTPAGIEKVTQRELVAEAVKDGPKSIKEIAEQTQILEPNVRRILGVGAKEGTFTRLDKGVYVLSKNGKDTAWVEAGDAVDVLPRLVKEGKKFHSIILDPAYFSKNLIGKNRGIKDYDFIMPPEFNKVAGYASQLVESDDSHVYLMLSGAKKSQDDMLKYSNAMLDSGFKLIGEGSYQKLFKNGEPVTNVRGEIAQPERLLLFTQSGLVRKGEIPVELNFRFVRPSRNSSYETEKAPQLMEALIKQSTFEGESVLDPFAGSGVTGAEAIKAGRKPTLIEKRLDAVIAYTHPRIAEAGGVELNEAEKFLVDAIKYREKEIKSLNKKIEAAEKNNQMELAQIYRNEIKFYKEVDTAEFAEDVRNHPDYYIKSNVDPFLLFKNRKINRGEIAKTEVKDDFEAWLDETMGKENLTETEEKKLTEIEQVQKETLKQIENDLKESGAFEFTGQQEANYQRFLSIVKDPKLLNPSFKEIISSSDVQAFKDLAKRTDVYNPKAEDIFGLGEGDDVTFNLFRERLVKENPKLLAPEYSGRKPSAPERVKIARGRQRRIKDMKAYAEKVVKKATIKEVPIEKALKPEQPRKIVMTDTKLLQKRLQAQAFGARKGKIIGREEAIQKMKDEKEKKELLESIKEGIIKGMDSEKNQIRRRIGFQRHTKNLGGSVLRRLKEINLIREWKNANQSQLQGVLKGLEELKPGDTFLTDNQLAALEDYTKTFPKDPRLITVRELQERFKEEDEIMNGFITGHIPNEIMPTVDIKESSAVIAKVVNNASFRFRVAYRNKVVINEEFSKIIKEAEQSRKQGMFKTETNKLIFRKLSGEDVELTPAEMDAYQYLKDYFEQAREALNLERHRRNYITHLPKNFMEKLVDSDFSLKKTIDSYKEKKTGDMPVEIMLNLDQIVGSEKFFKFAMERKGGVDATYNLRRILHEYSNVVEDKLALDKVLPEGQTVMRLLLQPKSAQWLKHYLQNLKGRGLDHEFKTGKMGPVLKNADFIIHANYFRLLGVNYMSWIKNVVAGETNSFIYQPFKNYLTGKYRLFSSPNKANQIIGGSGLLDGTYVELLSGNYAGKVKTAVNRIAFGGMEAGEYEMRGSYFLGELTDAEWKSGEISEERYREIMDKIAITQGVYTKIDSPLALQTTLGHVLGQFSRWKITNTMLIRRIVKGAKEEIKQKNYSGPNIKRAIKLLAVYAMATYLSYEATKAGYKKLSKIADAGTELLNVFITLPIQVTSSLFDNPTAQVLKALMFNYQTLLSHVGITKEPSSVTYNKGIEGQYIAIKKVIDEITGANAEEERIQNKKDEAKREKDQMKSTYEKVQNLVKSGKTSEAQQIIDAMTDAEYETYKEVKADAKRKSTLEAEEKMKPTVKRIMKLVEEGKKDEAMQIIDAMSEEEYRIYNLTKKKLGY